MKQFAILFLFGVLCCDKCGGGGGHIAITNATQAPVTITVTV